MTQGGELDLNSLNSWQSGEFVEEVLDYHREAETTATAHQLSTTRDFESQAKIACCQNDVFRQTWLVKFINCQVSLICNRSQIG